MILTYKNNIYKFMRLRMPESLHQWLQVSATAVQGTQAHLQVAIPLSIVYCLLTIALYWYQTARLYISSISWTQRVLFCVSVGFLHNHRVNGCSICNSQKFNLSNMYSLSLSSPPNMLILLYRVITLTDL